jgi:hypothetical protein
MQELPGHNRPPKKRPEEKKPGQQSKPGIGLERTASLIASLGRDELKARINQAKENGLKLDFTEDYLNSISLDRLRHIVLAIMLTQKK